jgi:hypothetical protein
MRRRHPPGWKSGPRAFALAHLRFALAIVLAASAGHAFAADREYVLRFLPPEGQVDGYEIHLAPEGAPFGDPQDIGFVAPDAAGIARATLLLDSTITYQVGMTAYNAAGESDLSNLLVIEAMACDPGLCEDGNSCTADACELTGCSHVPLVDGATCDDGFVDTVDDQCFAAECVGFAPQCTDRLACDDGNVCNGDEACGADGSCLAGTRLDCGESTACRESVCDPTQGCLTVPRPDGTRCDDGFSTTRGDRCLGGDCVGKGKRTRHDRSRR